MIIPNNIKAKSLLFSIIFPGLPHIYIGQSIVGISIILSITILNLTVFSFLYINYELFILNYLLNFRT